MPSLIDIRRRIRAVKSTQQIILIFAAINGYFDGVEVETIFGLEGQLYTFFANQHSSVLRDLVAKKTIDDDLKSQLHAAMKDFIKGVTAVKG